MDNILSNTIIIIILTLIVIIPVIIISRINSKKSYQKISEHFERLVRENSLNIAGPDFFSLKMIGVDEDKRVLVFVDHQGLNEIQQVIDLKRTGSCSIVKSTNNGAVSEIRLIFGSKSDSSILLYKQYRDKESDLKLLSEKAELWKQKLAGLTSEP